MELGGFIIRRVFSGMLVVLSVFIIGCWLIRQIPDAPAELELEGLHDPSWEFRSNENLPFFYWSVQADSILPYVCRMGWNGMSNQFHRTLTGYLSLDFGKSKLDGVPVLTKFLDALPWSVSIQLPAILLLFLLGIGWSIHAVVKPSKWYVRLINSLLIFLHSIPGFWLATVLLLLFANTQYLSIFPTGMQNLRVDHPMLALFTHPHYFILPILCLVLPSLAFLVQLLCNNMQQQMEHLVWTRAVSTGMKTKRAIFKEILPLALIPLGGWFAAILPALFSGSVILEQIFSIPGLGRLLYQAISNRDWPVVQFIFLVSGFSTVLGFVAADLLIRKWDPRHLKDQS